jgi:hypothetical protein
MDLLNMAMKSIRVRDLAPWNYTFKMTILTWFFEKFLIIFLD